MLNEKKRKQVYGVLITPIECIGFSDGTVNIKKTGNIIKTTQTYYPYKKWRCPLDEDMSDFAMGFYEILYKGLLGGNRMICDDDLVDRFYAGDTMNSFNYIANLFPQAGRSRNSRTPNYMWPKVLQEWELKYHCLANFWIIPMEIGRKNDNEFSKGSYENGLNDFMDRFLDLMSISDNFNKVFLGTYKSIDELAIIHFLQGSYVTEHTTIIRFSDKTDKPEIMIEKIFNCIKIRAKAIADSDYALELWNYFYSWGLVGD